MAGVVDDLQRVVELGLLDVEGDDRGGQVDGVGLLLDGVGLLHRLEQLAAIVDERSAHSRDTGDNIEARRQRL